MLPEEKTCRLWVRRYMKPSKRINHMHTSTGLRLMMQEDLGVTYTDYQFKKLVMSEGIMPVDRLAKEWEFRISSVPLRMRAKAEVGGWLPSMDPHKSTRMG